MTDVPFATSPSDVPLRVSGTFNAGQTARITWSGVHVDSPCGPYGYAVDIQTNTLDNLPEQRFSLGQPSGTIEMVISGPATEIQVIPFTSSRCSTGTLLGVEVAILGTAGHCQYGTERAPGVPTTLYLTPNLIASYLTNLGMSFLEQVFVQFWYSSVDLFDLCGSQPPPFPTIDLSTPAATSATLWNAMLSVVWSQNCRCTPGAPSPTPFPPPGASEPVGWPSAPAFDCTNVDPCGALVQLLQMVGSLQDSMREELNLTTLLQRYSLPFATISGATHSGLTGSGSFNVSRLIGVEVELVIAPEGKPVLEGNPPYIMNLGWMSVSDPDGLIEEKRFTRSRMTWFPKLMPMANLFGYALQEGVTMRVTELQAEP